MGKKLYPQEITQSQPFPLSSQGRRWSIKTLLSHDFKSRNTFWVLVSACGSLVGMVIRRWYKTKSPSLVAQMVKRLPTMRETRVQSQGREDLLEKEMVTHSSILAWKIPWMEKPGRLQSMGSQSVGHDWVTSLSYPGVWSAEGGRGMDSSCKYPPREGRLRFGKLKGRWGSGSSLRGGANCSNSNRKAWSVGWIREFS